MSAARPSSASKFKTADAETGQTPERGTTARRTKPVRITVDLTPEDYRLMRRVVDELAARTDIPTLAHSVMWRELLHLTDTDPEVFEAIATRIIAHRD